MLPYPSNIPPYNKFRAPIDEADIDTDDIVLVVYRMPKALRRWFVGNALLISDVNAIGGDYDNQIAVVDIVNQEIYSVDVCEIIADCIENNEDVRQALADYLNSIGLGSASDGIDSIVGSDNNNFEADNLLDVTACTDNEIAGQCVAIVEYLNTLAADFIEYLISLTGGLEQYGYIVDVIPQMLGLPDPDIGTFIDWIGDEVLTQYDGAYDTALRNEAACLLYQYACVSCELTLDDVITAFFTEISIGIDPTKTWSTFISDIITLSLADQIVYSMWSLIVANWKIGQSFQGISGIQALRYAVSGATPISPSVLGCDPCGAAQPCDWPVLIDFSSTPSCLTIVEGTIQNGYGNPEPCLRMTTNTSGTDTANCKIDLPAITDTPSVTVDAYGSNADDNVYLRIDARDASDNLLERKQFDSYSALDFTLDSWNTYTFTFTVDDVSYVQISCGIGGSVASQDYRLDNIVITE